MAWFVIAWYTIILKRFHFCKWMVWDWGLNNKERHPLMKAAILALSKHRSGSVCCGNRSWWNTVAHSCNSALCRNPDKSVRSSCHWYDVVRKQRDGLCCGVNVCILVCVCDSEPLKSWTGQNKSTAVQHYLKAAVKFSFFLNLLWSLSGKPHVPSINTHINLHNDMRGASSCSFGCLLGKDYKVSTWSRWAWMEPTNWQHKSHPNQYGWGGRGELRTVLFNRNKLLSTSRWHR